MGNTKSKEFDTVEAWKREGTLSIEKRRARYQCGKDFIKVEDLKTWDKSVSEAINSTLPLKKVDARNDEKQKRKSVLKLQRKQNKVVTEPPTETDLERKEKRRKQKQKEAEVAKFEKDEEDIPLAKFEHNDAINKKVVLTRMDITHLEIEAIVNAANSSLLGGGGIDGAIHRAAGETLRKECATLNGAKTGETKITRGYNLPSKYVLHTVGPIGREAKLLESCYSSCLDLIKKHNIRTVAFCGISTGIYGYPLYAASHIALNTIRKWLEDPNNFNSVDSIVFCTFLEKELECYDKLMPFYFPPKDSNTDDIIRQYKEAYDSYDPSSETDQLDKEVQEEEEERLKKKPKYIMLMKRKAKQEEQEKAKKEEEEDKEEENEKTVIVDQEDDKEKEKDKEPETEQQKNE